jgi:hypothetical protein
MRRCLEKSPGQRFQSCKDLAFALEALTQTSGSSSTSGAQAALQATHTTDSRRKLVGVTSAVLVAAAMFAAGWWLGRGSGSAPPPEFQQITFRAGRIGNARFAPDGSIVYAASWENGPKQLYMARTDEAGARELGMKDVELLAVSKRGELAVLLNSERKGGFARAGTLARVSASGGTPREILTGVQDADWAADGETMAVVRFVPETSHWRLEYPVGRALVDSINWVSNPRISPDGKSVAFLDHENFGGDDQGSVAVIGPDGHERKLSTGWSSVQGVVWAPPGDERWFSASDSGSEENLHAVTLKGKSRILGNMPGGMWLEDLRDGVALMVTQQARLNIRGTPPGGKEEHELGWLGWSYPRDISRDGKMIFFEEQAEGGGPNYTAFLRGTDGSPPIRIGEGEARAISPDNKWVITKGTKSRILNLVPVGAGNARPLTHDNITYGVVRFMPDGKQLLAGGIESGHGGRDYLIDLSNGNSQPVTPEGIVGATVSHDGRKIAVRGPDGKWGIWPLDGSGLRPIPGLDPKYSVNGWSPDDTSLYVFSSRESEKAAKIYRVNSVTGKIEFWKEFGNSLQIGANGVNAPGFSADGTAYAYSYVQALSQAYVVKGLK